MENKQEKIKELVQELETKGKVHLYGKGTLECKNNRIVFSNAFFVTTGVKFLSADETLKMIEDHISNSSNNPVKPASVKNNTLAALKKKMAMQ